jgi:hypothetical protein
MDESFQNDNVDTQLTHPDDIVEELESWVKTYVYIQNLSDIAIFMLVLSLCPTLDFACSNNSWLFLYLDYFTVFCLEHA